MSGSQLNNLDPQEGDVPGGRGKHCQSAPDFRIPGKSPTASKTPEGGPLAP